MLFFFFVFLKQKTAYEMRISDWSSDVCSSDLDTVNYATAKDQQAAAFDALAERARNAANAHPDQAAVQIWTGIVLASAAGAHGGMGALSLVKEARKYLEAALAIDPTALGGAAYTRLGSL